ncbi:hypothetical protein VE01_01489 [Pseudogymnoascus verrucosus]|uniref:Nuclease S1 n=1 Tax=Pseudogymnoascus verrucosus TaxID=342668 RepID=A0A1B8GWT5_9PEZI|nr:uncharacterized protein VE01_01489 [Pseudogymnoascus verrucosus]OBU00298.1 hypothetical protein VE01_01489 [Pseudogymnoascus verrucosus]
MKPSLSLPLLLLPILPSVSAWGSLGHMTVAYLAEHLVAPRTAVYMQQILSNPSSPGYLGSIATWADSYRYTKDGRYSAHLHYIDADDSPPWKCGLDIERDCADEFCIVSAIGNYTSRLMDADLNPYQRAIAAKFVVHFIGDIHQPLHTEGLLRGGNGIKVRFGARNSNLHSVWDSALAEHLIGGYTPTHARSWAGTLLSSIEGGVYSSLVDEWREDISLGDVENSVMRWAQESNRLVCEVVVPEGGWEELQGKDLSGEYYEQAIGKVEMQVARAGVRLAEWLDLVAGGEDGRGEL